MNHGRGKNRAKLWKTLLKSALGGAALCMASMAWSVSVTYVGTDLADVVPGTDRWQYSYTLSGSLDAFDSVNLLFSPTLYANLALGASSSAVLPLISQPDPALPADGQLTVMALAQFLASDTATVDITFDWRGSGTPGSQPFEILDEQFNQLGTGTTAPTVQTPPTTSVPEPEPSILLLAGLILLGAVMRRNRPVTDTLPS